MTLIGFWLPGDGQYNYNSYFICEISYPQSKIHVNYIKYGRLFPLI